MENNINIDSIITNFKFNSSLTFQCNVFLCIAMHFNSFFSIKSDGTECRSVTLRYIRYLLVEILIEVLSYVW